ncbi:MAG: LEA type 2 family protein [Acidobacteriota bacterium]
MLRPSSDLPLGGLGVRLWAKVSNPNPFGFTLQTLTGTLFLEGTRGATADFPLGLVLQAGQESEVPLDLSVNLSDLAGLADVARQATEAKPIAYRFEGTIGVDAGRLGQPTFGPMTVMTGELTAR